MKDEEITMYTDVSVRKVEQILAHFRRTGDVDGPKQLQPPGPKATLGHHDVQVRLYLCVGIVADSYDFLVHVREAGKPTRLIP